MHVHKIKLRARITHRSFAAPAPAIRDFFWLYHTYILYYAGVSIMPPRVLAQRPKPCGGNNRLRHSSNGNFSVAPSRALFPAYCACVMSSLCVLAYSLNCIFRDSPIVFIETLTLLRYHTKFDNTPQRTTRTSTKTRGLAGVTYRSEYCFVLYLHR